MVSDCEELVGLLTGDDGVDRGDFTWMVVNMDLIVEVRANKPSTLTDCLSVLQYLNPYSLPYK